MLRNSNIVYQKFTPKKSKHTFKKFWKLKGTQLIGTIDLMASKQYTSARSRTNDRDLRGTTTVLQTYF